MSTDPEPALHHAIPRPGVLKALGICNIVFSVLGSLCIFSTGLWYVAVLAGTPPPAEVKVEVQGKTGGGPGVPMVAAFNPFMMGMDDIKFVRFSLLENGTNLLINGLMFASGIGLLNQRRWAVRWWSNLSWVRLVLTFLLWGYFIVGVSPGLSESMARNVSAMIAKQGNAPGRTPAVADLTRIYSIFCLLLAVGAIAISSIYPAISLWLLGRPGVKAAIVDPPSREPESP